MPMLRDKRDTIGGLPSVLSKTTPTPLATTALAPTAQALGRPDTQTPQYTAMDFGGDGRSRLGINWGKVLAAKYNDQARRTAAQQLGAEATFANAATARGLLPSQIAASDAGTALTRVRTQQLPLTDAANISYLGAQTAGLVGRERRASAPVSKELALFESRLRDIFSNWGVLNRTGMMPYDDPTVLEDADTYYTRPGGAL